MSGKGKGFEAYAREDNEGRARELAHIRAQLKIKAGVVEDGNGATVDSLDTCPRSLDELLDACGIDRDVWDVERSVVNTWPVGARVGDVIVRTPLYQVKAWLRRRVAVAVSLPPVQPVSVTVRARPAKRRPADSSVKRAIIMPDAQIGFRRDIKTGGLSPLHDRRAMDVAWQIAEHAQPDRVILLGDMLDCPEWTTKYHVSPDFYHTTQAAVVEFAHWLARLRAISPDLRITYILGNHEKRMSLALESSLRAAYDLRPADDVTGHPLLSIARLLGLESLNVELSEEYPLGETWINSNLNVHHGHVVRSKSGATVAAVVQDARASTISGHIHRTEMAAKTGWSQGGPHTYMAMSPGTLCNIEPGVVPGNSARPNWQQGVADVYYEETGDEFFSAFVVPINRGRAICDGRIFEARPEADIIAEIERDTKFRVS